MYRSFLLCLLGLGTMVQAQNVYDVCDGQELCLCWDEPQQSQTYTFKCGEVGAVVVVHFCEAQLDIDDNLLIWAGAVGGIPATPPTGTGDLSGITVYSLGNTLSFSLVLNDEPPGFPVCGDGVTSPWRLVVYGMVDGTEEQPPCTGTGPLCLTAGVQVAGIGSAEWVHLAGEQLVINETFQGATIDLFDTSGRLAAQLPMKGRTSVALPSELPNGVYTVRSFWKQRPLAARILLAR